MSYLIRRVLAKPRLIFPRINGPIIYNLIFHVHVSNSFSSLGRAPSIGLCIPFGHSSYPFFNFSVFFFTTYYVYFIKFHLTQLSMD